MLDNKIIVITGFSGSGKDTILNILKKKLGLNGIVSNTTRPMRKGEQQGVEYNFKKDSKEFFEDDYIEYREYNTLEENQPQTWFYGIPESAIEDNKSYVVVLEIEGLKKLKEIYPERVISFFIDVDDEIRKERVKKRGDFDIFEWNRRLQDDKKRFSEKEIQENTDYIVCNRTLNTCIYTILHLLKRRESHSTENYQLR